MNGSARSAFLAGTWESPWKQILKVHWHWKANKRPKRRQKPGSSRGCSTHELVLGLGIFSGCLCHSDLTLGTGQCVGGFSAAVDGDLGDSSGLLQQLVCLGSQIQPHSSLWEQHETHNSRVRIQGCDCRNSLSVWSSKWFSSSFSGLSRQQLSPEYWALMVWAQNKK